MGGCSVGWVLRRLGAMVGGGGVNASMWVPWGSPTRPRGCEGVGLGAPCLSPRLQGRSVRSFLFLYPEEKSSSFPALKKIITPEVSIFHRPPARDCREGRRKAGNGRWEQPSPASRGGLQAGAAFPGSLLTPHQAFGAGGLQEKPETPFPGGFSLIWPSCVHPTAGTLVGREHPQEPRPAPGTPIPLRGPRGRRQTSRGRGNRRCLDWKRGKKR